MTRPKPNNEKKICEAALQLAAKYGWGELTVGQIAKAARIPAAQAQRLFTSTSEILPAIVRLIDSETTASVGKISSRGAPHDRLFEVMMARFDALQSRRDGILAIVAAMKRDPQIALPVLQAQWQAMPKMIGLAKLGLADSLLAIAALGLFGVYEFSLWCWIKDQTADMAKTMAALDHSLRYAGTFSEILFRDRK